MARGQGAGRSQIGWVWMVVAAVLIALGLVRLAQRERGAEAPPQEERQELQGDPLDADAAYPAVEDFHSFAESPPDGENDRATEDFAAAGLILLSDAIESIMRRAEADVMLHEMHLISVRERSDLIAASPESPDNAADMRTASLTCSHLLAELQRGHFPEARQSVAELNDITETIDADRPLEQQRRVVERFFGHASQTIREMNQHLTLRTE